MNEIKSTKKLFFYLWLPLYLSSIVLSIYAIVYDYFALHVVFKSIFMPLLSLCALLHWNGPLNYPFYLLQAAYLGAWIGDICMAFHNMYPVLYGTGAACFLSQHVLYIWLNMLLKGKQNTAAKKPLYGLPYLTYPLLFYVICYPPDMDHVIRGESIIYSLFLATSFITSINRAAANRKKYLMLVAGFGLFVLSDIVIVVDKFIIPFFPISEIVILSTYYVAQTMILYGSIPEKLS